MAQPQAKLREPVDGKVNNAVEFEDLVEHAGRLLQAAGVNVILIGAVLATVQFAMSMRHGGPVDDSYRQYRRLLARAILLGLEFLVAGDIVRTVVIEPTFRSVGILAVIVIIRTFLSTELELEIEGRWPWQRALSRERTTPGAG